MNLLAEIGHEVEVGAKYVVIGLEDVGKLATRVVAAEQLLTDPKIKAAAALILKDALTVAAYATVAGADVSKTDWIGTVTASEATIEAIKALVADAIAGEKTVVAAFKALGVAVPVAPAAAASK